ncbi:MAG: hypothetical protein KKF24_14580 [Gammaproteobacteria bacterium]|nr:hypothetical protein [Gammaproteobacteria bacterium]MBU1833906.1 hypothetical protein [Gammaproteobacteria bacterium]
MLHKLSKFGLPVWFITSFSLWIWLPTNSLLAITPSVCAVLLSAVGGVLGLALYQVYLAQFHHHKGFYTALCSALLAPPVAIIFSYKLSALLAAYPLRELAALVWFLSSMGTVLTVIVCRLLSEVIMRRPNYVDSPSLRNRSAYHNQSKAKFNTAIHSAKPKI